MISFHDFYLISGSRFEKAHWIHRRPEREMAPAEGRTRARRANHKINIIKIKRMVCNKQNVPKWACEKWLIVWASNIHEYTVICRGSGSTHFYSLLAGYSRERSRSHHLTNWIHFDCVLDQRVVLSHGVAHSQILINNNYCNDAIAMHIISARIHTHTHTQNISRYAYDRLRV